MRLILYLKRFPSAVQGLKTSYSQKLLQSLMERKWFIPSLVGGERLWQPLVLSCVYNEHLTPWTAAFPRQTALPEWNTKHLKQCILPPKSHLLQMDSDTGSWQQCDITEPGAGRTQSTCRQQPLPTRGEQETRAGEINGKCKNWRVKRTFLNKYSEMWQLEILPILKSRQTI